MNEKEYKNLVKYVRSHSRYKNIPEKLIDDYTDWKKRVTLGKFLTVLREYESAIRIFKTIIDVETVSSQDVEQKAWAMDSLGVCIWKEEKDEELALKYIDMALVLIENMDEKLDFLLRGEVWRHGLKIILESGKEKEAIEKANLKILSLEKETNKSNSYLFHAYDFKSEIAYKKNDIDKAIVYLKNGLQYFPKKEQYKKSLEQVLENNKKDKRKTYEKMKKIPHQIAVWDI